MSNKWSVYCHQNKINGKKYFGITCKIPKYRWGSCGQNYAHYFGRAVKKYGWDNFEHIVLYNNLTRETAIMFEKFLIEAFSTQNDKFGYNLTSGGDGNANPPPEVRKRLSKNNKGKHNPSAETRAKISAGNKGKVVSAETRKKISENCGSKRPEVRAQISKSLMGRTGYKKGEHYTEEEKARLYATRRGRHWKMSDEGRAKISQARRAYEQRRKSEVAPNE